MTGTPAQGGAEPRLMVTLQSISIRKELLMTAGVLFSVATLSASSPPVIGAVSAQPSQILVATAVPVTITAQITGPTLIDGGVKLLRLGSAGTQPSVLGTMQDNGLAGDAIAGDHI